jgi:hypothetical protein
MKNYNERKEKDKCVGKIAEGREIFKIRRNDTMIAYMRTEKCFLGKGAISMQSDKTYRKSKSH